MERLVRLMDAQPHGLGVVVVGHTLALLAMLTVLVLTLHP